MRIICYFLNKLTTFTTKATTINRFINRELLFTQYYNNLIMIKCIVFYYCKFPFIGKNLLVHGNTPELKDVFRSLQIYLYGTMNILMEYKTRIIASQLANY